MNKYAIIENGVVKNIVIFNDGEVPPGAVLAPEACGRGWFYKEDGTFEPPPQKEINDDDIRQEALNILLDGEREKAMNELVEEKVRPLREKYEAMTTEQLIKQVQARKRR